MTELEGWKMFPQASRKMSRSPRWICQCGTLRRKMAREIDRNPFGTGKMQFRLPKSLVVSWGMRAFTQDGWLIWPISSALRLSWSCAYNWRGYAWQG